MIIIDIFNFIYVFIFPPCSIYHYGNVLIIKIIKIILAKLDSKTCLYFESEMDSNSSPYYHVCNFLGSFGKLLEKIPIHVATRKQVGATRYVSRHSDVNAYPLPFPVLCSCCLYLSPKQMYHHSLSSAELNMLCTYYSFNCWSLFCQSFLTPFSFFYLSVSAPRHHTSLILFHYHWVCL